MTKAEMAQVLRSVGVNENTITAMENAFDMGVVKERERCANIVYSHYESTKPGEGIPEDWLLTIAEVISKGEE